MGKTIEVENSKSSKPSKKKCDEVLTKVIIRRLPPSFREDKLLSKFTEIFPEGLPDYDYFKFCGSDLSFSPIPFCRAYVNFKNPKDILRFKEKLDGYVFDDGKGSQYPVVVEFAPFQGVPRRTRRRKDIKCGTIEKDSDYLSFLETFNQEIEPLPSAEVYLEQQEANKQNMKDIKITTPLIEFIKMKRTSGKSRTSQRASSSSSNSNDKKRKPPKESGKAAAKNSYSEKPPRSQSESSKKGSEKKVDDSRSSRKFGKEDGEKKRQGNYQTSSEKKTGKSHEWKEKVGEKDEKEKTVRKERPTSAKSWKDNKSQDDYHRSGSSSGRPTSSYHTPRKERGTKETARVSENVDKNRSESVHSIKNERRAEKNEEKTPNKHQTDNKERVRNKDRPAQAIYQPRSRSRVDPDDSSVKNSGRSGTKEQKEKHPGKGYRDSSSRDRDSSSRDRDNRDNGRRQNRDSHKIRGKATDTNATKE